MRPARIRVPELALGLLLVAASALVAVLWYTSVTTEETVVVAARDLPRGHLVSAADLRAATVSGADGVVLLPGSEAHRLLDQVVLHDVAASTPLTLSMVGRREPLGADEGLFGLSLGPGQAPLELGPFDVVRLVVTSVDPLGTVATPPAVLEHTAEVWSVSPPTDFDPSTLVTLRGPLALAAEVAAAQQVRLVVVEAPGP